MIWITKSEPLLVKQRASDGVGVRTLVNFFSFKNTAIVAFFSDTGDLAQIALI